MLVSPTRIVFALTAVIAVTICCAQESNAQRGFRIGNVLQAGGGQGFRLGGERLGMQFGGGQGAIIGGQNVGMRFGNGHGARFGSRDFGMQFGGGQGTQIGRLSTPSGYYNGAVYNGAVQNQAYSQPMVIGQPIIGQSIVGQPYATQPVQPMVASPIPQGGVTGENQGVVNSSYAQPTTGFSQGVTQVDIARAAVEAEVSETETSESVAPVKPLIESSLEENAGEATPATPLLKKEKDEIRLSLPASETEPFQYKVNGSERVIKPGEAVVMAAGEEWKIEFDGGGELGGREAILKDGGAFAFEKTDAEGWVLMKNPMPQTAAPVDGDTPEK